jgi:hypothetical protein
LEAPPGGEQRIHEGTQKPLEAVQAQTEVVADIFEYGVDAVAVAAFEVIAAHPMRGFYAR